MRTTGEPVCVFDPEKRLEPSAVERRIHAEARRDHAAYAELPFGLRAHPGKRRICVGKGKFPRGTSRSPRFA